MDKNQPNIYIIGAGVSGLVAAIELERNGYSATILEKNNRIGGRVQTDIENGILFDHGFQVLLTQYPGAKRYLDLDQLDLQFFLPGALIFNKKRMAKIGDPIRDFSFLFSTLFAGVGSLQDKIRILKLSNQLKKQAIDAIFKAPELTTYDYLKKFGFSEKIINQFFRPFFSGIFLEPNLDTSSRMFCFVYKMFTEGLAALPKLGIQQIPLQLKDKLKRSRILLNTEVARLDGTLVTLIDGSTLQADKLIIASDLIGQLNPANESNKLSWNNCENLYFEVPGNTLQEAIIGLIPDEESLVNNFHFLNSIWPNIDQSILSVTIVKEHQLTQEELIEQIQLDMKNHTGIDGMKFLKAYSIPKALPRLKSMKYAPNEEDAHLSKDTFLCGDYLANPSLNAAMESGRVAAEALVKSL